MTCVDVVSHLMLNIRVAETESHEGKRRVEAMWPIFK